MLRRKLLFILGPLVALIMGTALVSLWLLQEVLQDLNHVDGQAWVTVDQVNDLSTTINAIESDLYELRLGRTQRLDALIDSVDQGSRLLESIGESSIIRRPENESIYLNIRAAYPAFKSDVGALATTPDEQLVKLHTESALQAAVKMRVGTLPLSRQVRDYARLEQEAIAARFRWVVLGLGLVFLLVINVSVMVLIRVAGMVLRPVDRLVEATRELARERFDYRVELEGKDEFCQLAAAYNHLAEQLQANEQRKIEMVGQVALALNHELNNVISIIDLQLRLLSRRVGGEHAPEQYLMQIAQSLQRMTRTVEALKHVRRIVLTDYISGIKMLDLEKSTEEEEAHPSMISALHRNAAV